MNLRTAAEYADSLVDNRDVRYRGKRVDNVTTNEVFRRAIDHASIDFDIAHDGTVGAVDGDHSAFFSPPRSVEALRRRAELIELVTVRGATVIPLVKEIGSDALFALTRLASKMGRSAEANIAAFVDHCRDGDLALSVAQTDVKGDRTLSPSQQPDADAYLRVVERHSDGIVVRGAKVHTSCTPYVNELIVLPTRAMSAADADYAVAFAIPVATPGLTMVASPFGREGKTEFDNPISSRHQMIETVTIFDDVFVPDDRVFLDRQAELAGPLAIAFVDYHRFTAIAYKLPLVDALCGAAHLVAEANGIMGKGHVRDKLVWLISYAENLRALVEMSAQRAEERDGLFVPDPLTVNIAKSHFAHGFHTALQHVQELSGGLLVTGPSGEDLDADTGPALRRFLRASGEGDGEARLRLLKLIADLTTGELGGYHAVLALHAEGSLEAEKLQISRAYDPARSTDLVRGFLSAAPR